MEVLSLKKERQATVLDRAGRLLKRGGIVVYPTETAYAIGADATQAKAVARVFAIKGRMKKREISVLMSGKRMATRYGHFSLAAEKLWDAFLPGPLTLIISGKDGGTIGLRCSSHPVAQALVRAYGCPITATSANLSHSPPLYTSDAIRRVFEKRRIRPDLFIDAGVLPKRRGSTVVDCTGKNVRILRKGPISARAIRRALRS